MIIVTRETGLIAPGKKNIYNAKYIKYFYRVMIILKLLLLLTNLHLKCNEMIDTPMLLVVCPNHIFIGFYAEDLKSLDGRQCRNILIT